MDLDFLGWKSSQFLSSIGYRFLILQQAIYVFQRDEAPIYVSGGDISRPALVEAILRGGAEA